MKDIRENPAVSSVLGKKHPELKDEKVDVEKQQELNNARNVCFALSSG